jgi:hypothetical protein
MQLAALWFGLLVVACSITHKSDSFACGPNGECASGRTCEDGFCVVTGGPLDDARKPGDDAPIKEPDANKCPDQCTTCDLDNSQCLIDCTQANCDGPVKCPPGFSCEIDCNEDGSCTHGVDCTDSVSCDVTCTGDGSCKGVVCGDGRCDVTCLGDQSCRTVNCEKSCACDVTCGDAADCTAVTCTAPQCDGAFGGGCRSSNFMCDSCQ